jgi:hypothetical protein
MSCDFVRDESNPFAYATNALAWPTIVICNPRMYQQFTIKEKHDRLSRDTSDQKDVNAWLTGSHVLLHELLHLDAVSSVKDPQYSVYTRRCASRTLSDLHLQRPHCRYKIRWRERYWPVRLRAKEMREIRWDRRQDAVEWYASSP